MIKRKRNTVFQNILDECLAEFKLSNPKEKDPVKVIVESVDGIILTESILSMIKLINELHDWKNKNAKT